MINEKLQSRDKSATVVGKDRIHPQSDPGHFVMSYLFLKSQNVPKYVSNLVIDVSDLSIIKSENCQIKSLKKKEVTHK